MSKKKGNKLLRKAARIGKQVKKVEPTVRHAIKEVLQDYHNGRDARKAEEAAVAAAVTYVVPAPVAEPVITPVVTPQDSLPQASISPGSTFDVKETDEVVTITGTVATATAPEVSLPVAQPLKDEPEASQASQLAALQQQIQNMAQAIQELQSSTRGQAAVVVSQSASGAPVSETPSSTVVQVVVKIKGDSSQSPPPPF